MKEYLKVGTELQLRGIDGTYFIRKVVGRGSSCVVYWADFINEIGVKSEHLLKEFNPKNINIGRNDDLSLQINAEEQENFDEAKKRFRDGFRSQLSFREKSGLKNYTANIQNVYEDYNTIYIDMNVTEGISYDLVEEKSIYNLARRMKVLAQIVEKYHENGYLHLDLKPSNIYVRPENETCEDMLLFDFDSMVKKSELRDMGSISYTEGWAALELTSASRRNSICEATDIFAIGEIFFEKLMGRHSEPWERRTFSKYVYDFDSPIFENVDLSVIEHLNVLFRHTLCNNVSTRYQDTSGLISVLDRIIDLVGSDGSIMVRKVFEEYSRTEIRFDTDLLKQNLMNTSCESEWEYMTTMNEKIRDTIEKTFVINSTFVSKYINDYAERFDFIRRDIRREIVSEYVQNQIAGVIIQAKNQFVEFIKNSLDFSCIQKIKIDLQDEKPDKKILIDLTRKRKYDDRSTFLKKICHEIESTFFDPQRVTQYTINLKNQLELIKSLEVLAINSNEYNIWQGYKRVLGNLLPEINDLLIQLPKGDKHERTLFQKGIWMLRSEDENIREQGLSLLFRDYEEKRDEETLNEINRWLPLSDGEVLEYIGEKIFFLRRDPSYKSGGRLLFGVKTIKGIENIIFELYTTYCHVNYRAIQAQNKVYVLIDDDQKAFVYSYNPIDDTMVLVATNDMPSMFGEYILECVDGGMINYGICSHFDPEDRVVYSLKI